MSFKRHKNKLNVRSWATGSNIFQFLPDSTRALFLKRGEERLLHTFSDLCDIEVMDRDVEFTLDQRKALYRRWLGSGLPCLMFLVDQDDNALVASIVLSLTEAAFREFWYKGRDALDIDITDLLSAGQKPSRQYLLVDMLARHRNYIKKLSKERKAGLSGIGFRALTRHLSEFAPANAEFSPVLLCSTVSRKLQTLLNSFGFESVLG